MRFFLFLVFTFCISLGWSQAPLFHIDGTTKNRTSGKPEAGVKIELIQGGSVVLQSITQSNGKYELKGAVDFKKPFEVKFSKSGFVSKKLSFDYSKMNVEDAPPGDIRPFKSAEFEMVPSDPNVDLAFLESEPVGKFYWDDRKLTGAFDQAHNDKVKNRIEKVIADRKVYFEKGELNWATAELLAYGSLLTEGYDVRMSGQDVERGTFSHRHAVVKVEDSEEEVVLLNHIENKKGNFYIYNSHLSEYGVVGFEYGYALASPNTLTIWEAQFGDFSNGAQIMIDQYISAGEDKWNNQNGLVMLLPHGYENQGAEHSSARMERFLQLCAKHNMYVADVTTPANFFHLMRRQMKTNFRKPLIVFSPKSLLRHPIAVSTADEFANGQFQEILDDPNATDKKAIKTLVFCTGKVYYDIIAKREELGRNDVAVVRLEQLFPLATEQIKAIIESYPNADDYVWAQEEPKNMGAYSYMLMNFDLVKLRLASPKAYSAPAAGSYERSKKRQANAIAMVFDKNLFQ